MNEVASNEGDFRQNFIGAGVPNRSNRTIRRSAEGSAIGRVNRKDLRAVAKAYNMGKSEGGQTSAYRMVRAVLAKQHPEVARLDELTLSHRVSQVIHMAMLAGYLCL